MRVSGSDSYIRVAVLVAPQMAAKLKLNIHTNTHADRETHTGVGAQSTLRGQDIFARKIRMKNYQNTRIFMTFAMPEKLIKFPNFTGFT